MKLESGLIKGRQLTFYVSVFIQGSLFCTTFIYDIVYRDVWIATILSFGVFLLFSFVYLGLVKAMPGKNLMEMDEAVFGPYLGKAVSAVYIYFFLTLAVANIRFACDFLNGLFMDETPALAFAVVLILTLAWAVRSGIEVLARMSFVLLITVSLSILFILVSNFNQMEFKNFLPVLRISALDFVHVNHIITSIIFGETFVFMMIIPYVGEQNKVKKSLFLGIAIGEITLLIVCMVITATMDSMSRIISNPIIVMVREINIGDVITRIEFLTMAVIMFSIFMKISAIYYALTLSIAQVLRLKTYRSLAVPVAALMLALTMPMFRNPIVQAENGKEIWPFYASIFEFALPLITLITAKLRGISRAKGG